MTSRNLHVVDAGEPPLPGTSLVAALVGVWRLVDAAARPTGFCSRTTLIYVNAYRRRTDRGSLKVLRCILLSSRVSTAAKLSQTGSFSVSLYLVTVITDFQLS